MAEPATTTSKGGEVGSETRAGVGEVASPGDDVHDHHGEIVAGIHTTEEFQHHFQAIVHQVAEVRSEGTAVQGEGSEGRRLSPVAAGGPEPSSSGAEVVGTAWWEVGLHAGEEAWLHIDVFTSVPPKGLVEVHAPSDGGVGGGAPADTDSGGGSGGSGGGSGGGRGGGESVTVGESGVRGGGGGGSGGVSSNDGESAVEPRLAFIGWTGADGRESELFEIVVTDTRFRWRRETSRFGILYCRGEAAGALGFYFNDAKAADAATEFITHALEGISAAPSSQPRGAGAGQGSALPSLSAFYVGLSSGLASSSPLSSQHAKSSSCPTTHAPLPSTSGSSDALSGASAGVGLEASRGRRSGSVVSEPFAVTHDLSVKWDPARACYVGLPSEWGEAGKQFGVALADCPKTDVPGLGPVPSVLLMLQRVLSEAGGIPTEGIFRRAASRSDLDAAKKAINEGKFEGSDNPHLAAGLIKVWFRELDPGLLNRCSEGSLAMAADRPNLDGVSSVVLGLPVPERACMLWVLDLAVTICSRMEENRMNPTNLAIVLAPNLYSVTASNPMAALTLSQQIVTFTRKAIEWRQATSRGTRRG